jgi:penicillin-binding protein 2
VGELLTAEGMSNMYKAVGFGRRVPLAASNDFPSGLYNTPGWVPNQAWLIRKEGRGMSVGDARNLAIGQGALAITPLQAALMVGEIITGQYRTPKIYTTEPDGLAFPVELSPNVRRLAREGMFQVINDPNATGYKYAYTDLCPLAAKTGSAQAPPRAIEWEMSWKDPATGKLIKQTTTNTDKFYQSAPVPRKIINQRAITFYPTLRPEDQKDETGRTKDLAHAWFVGYAPANHPRIVTVVFIEYGLAGGSAAGPVFRDIMLKCRELGYFK